MRNHVWMKLLLLAEPSESSMQLWIARDWWEWSTQKSGIDVSQCKKGVLNIRVAEVDVIRMTRSESKWSSRSMNEMSTRKWGSNLLIPWSKLKIIIQREVVKVLLLLLSYNTIGNNIARE